MSPSSTVAESYNVEAKCRSSPSLGRKVTNKNGIGNSGEQPKIGSAGTTQDRSPLDAVYLNNSASIIAKKRPHSDAWKFPQESIKWEWTSVSLSDFISKTEQVNMQESTKSHLGLGEEMALTILCMAASLVPYVGPFLATAGSLGIEQLKGVTTDSPASLPFGDCIR